MTAAGNNVIDLPLAPATPRAVSTGAIRFGEAEVDCYNLDDGRRVISQRGVVRALSSGGPGGGRDRGDLLRYLERLPTESSAILAAPSAEVAFVLPSGTVAHGRDAEWFIDLCNAYLDAAIAGSLHPKQRHIAAQARVIVAACSKVGIAALIDEATGFQYVREHGILGDIFARALRDKPAQWARAWQDDVIDALCRTFRIQRLGKEFPAPLMGVVGKLYRTLLGADVYDELRRRNPPGEDRDIHTQWMSDEVLAAMRDHMGVIRAFAMVCDSKLQFWERLERYAGGGRGQVELFLPQVG